MGPIWQALYLKDPRKSVHNGERLIWLKPCEPDLKFEIPVLPG